MNSSITRRKASSLLLAKPQHLQSQCRRSIQLHKRLLSSSQSLKKPESTKTSSPPIPQPTKTSTPPKPLHTTSDANAYLAHMAAQSRLNRISRPSAPTSTYQPETPLSLWQRSVEEHQRPKHLSPRTGRTFDVTRPSQSELTTRMNQVTMICMANKVAQMERRGKFHERPGIKRKRVRREKWRSKFAKRFGAICGRVKWLSSQGW
jgi:hypothetical protein